MDMEATKRSSLIIGRVIAKAWNDAHYREALRGRPVETLAAAGIRPPEGVELVVLEDTPDLVHVVVPAPWTARLGHEGVSQVMSDPKGALKRAGLPVVDRARYVVAQDTVRRRHLVIPVAPSPAELSIEVIDFFGGGQ
jgi:hypothetical protein